MARTALSVQQIAVAGLTPALTAANVAGHSFTNNEKTFLQVVNGAGAGITVTVVTAATANGEPVADRAVTVAAGATALIGPFPSFPFEAADRSINVDFSSVTTITCAAFTL